MNPTFVAINNPLAVNGTYAGSEGINDSGTIVGTYLDDNSVAQGFIDINGNFTTVTDPTVGTNGTYAFGINDSGEVVGYFETYTVGAGTHLNGYVYRDGVYKTISDPLGIATFALGINNKGDVVGDYQFLAGQPGNYHGGEEGFIYSKGKYTTISDPSGTVTAATGINDKGDIVGLYEDSNGGVHGFLYSHGQYTTINDPLATNLTVLNGINDKGQIVGYYNNGGAAHSFLYDHGIFVPINDPLGQATAVLGINNHSDIVGISFGDTGTHATNGFVVHGVSAFEV